jgi:hypothetical protein
MKRFEGGYRTAAEKGQEIKHQPMRFFWKGNKYGKVMDRVLSFKESEKWASAKWADRFKGSGRGNKPIAL